MLYFWSALFKKNIVSNKLYQKRIFAQKTYCNGNLLNIKKQRPFDFAAQLW